MCVPANNLRENIKPLIFNNQITYFQKILQNFYREYGSPSLKTFKIAQTEIPKALFDIFLNIIQSGNIKYKPEKLKRTDILAMQYGSSFEADCYDLSRAFIKLLLRLGIPRKDAFEKVYSFKMSKILKTTHIGVYGAFSCFDKTQDKLYWVEGSRFFFDNHAVAKVFDHYYDLTFMCHYDEENSIFDTSPKGEIFSAAANNNFTRVKTLLEKYPDFDINSLDNKGQTLLHWAVLNQNKDMVVYLIERGINLYIINVYDNMAIQLLETPTSEFYLFLQRYYKPEVVHQHLSQFSTDSKMLWGFTAIRNNNFELFKNLFRSDSILNVNDKDDRGCTLLHWVCYYNRFEMGEYLLNLNADPNITNRQNLYPIELLDDANTPLFKLLAYRTDTHVAYRKMQECLESQSDRLRLKQAIDAIKNKDVFTLTQCLSQGLDINSYDFEGFSLLHYAAIFKHERIAQFLLHKGADLQKTNKYGLLAIHYLQVNETSFNRILLRKMYPTPEVESQQFKNDRNRALEHLPAALTTRGDTLSTRGDILTFRGDNSNNRSYHNRDSDCENEKHQQHNRVFGVFC